MSKPWIGVSPQYDFDKNIIRIDPHYFDALTASGAVPVLLPLEPDAADIPALAAKLDGFLFSGGPDPLPLYYGQETQPFCGRIDHRRDALEMALLQEVMRLRKPVLGVCRGIQMINVARGGSLYQDIPAQLPACVLHDQQRPFEAQVHRVSILPGTLLADILKTDTLGVNSLHHQAVCKLAPGLVEAAHSSDGVIEALCGPASDGFLLGVQWHPELLFSVQAEARAIFSAFVNACC